MRKDFDVEIYKYPTTMEKIRIYPLGDLHIGSPEFCEEHWKKWKKMVMDDEYSRVVLIGDMMDNGLKMSKTDSYEATMRPREQKEWLKTELAGIKDKIIGVVNGNHEYRSARECDDSPLYDVLCKLDLEHLYRENIAFIKISLGLRAGKDRQISYAVALSHGKSRGRVERFSYALDGVDILITGHTHDPSNTFPSKLVFDMHNECIRQVDMVQLTVPSFLNYGGYGMRDMYMPKGFKIPVIELSGETKQTSLYWL